MKALRVSDELKLPLESVTSTFGLLAVRGAGKSNAGAVMAEEMFAAGLPFVAVDPVGSWAGLRAGPDGKPSGGLPVPIFGGRYGDVPLERGAGELVADLIVEQRLSCVLDLSEFESEAAKKQFLLAFATRLYRKNRDPLHLFLEECDDYLPQKPQRDELQLLRAFENIVRRGRSRGLGMTLISQRSAVVAKNVLTQVETLFVLRTTGPQDLAAVEAWVKYHQVGTDMLKTLAGLEDGEAWVWSPHFLGKTERFRFRKRQTFDTGATPKNVHGKDARKVATLADVDLVALKGRMAETIERAKADDPKALRARIATLEKELAATQKAKAAAPVETRVEVPMFDKALFQSEVENEFTQLVANFRGAMSDYKSKLLGQNGATSGLAGKPRPVAYVAVDSRCPHPARNGTHEWYVKPKTGEAQCRACGAETNMSNVTVTVHPRRLPEPGPAKTLRERTARVGNRDAMPGNGAGEKMGGAERKILTALAQRGKPLEKSRLAIRAGYSAGGGGFNNALGALRKKGWISGSNGQDISLTDAGREALGDYTELPEGAELVEYWKGQVGKAERAILEALDQALEEDLAPMTKEAVAKAAGYAPDGGGFNNALGRLRTLGLIQGRGELSLSGDLA